MRIKQQLARIMPAFLERAYSVRREMKELSPIQRLKCETRNLRPRSKIDLKELFDSREIEMRWEHSTQKIAVYAIPDGTGGVNPGDRKAIYYLISKLNPSSVLEIGTHIGASTLHIASALFMNRTKGGRQADIVSVDSNDVNSPASKPWLKHGTRKSPIEMVREMGYEAFVEFINDTSLGYFTRCERRFDFIFLDGDHTARTVYQEIPAALNLLNQNGVILLHDYFPNLKPLWSNGLVIPGPFLAAERLAKEGANFVVLPLGKLPWPTKLESNVTSLALVLRKE
ncbi:MAG: class I SAM-dependent methyltransferase [Chlamydiota bacterium]